MILGWRRSDASITADSSQAIAASEEGERAAGLDAAAHDVALKDVKVAEECCLAAEAELETLHNEWAAKARQCEA